MSSGIVVAMNRQKNLGEVARKLHSAALHLMRHVRALDSEMGIGPAQASALSVLVFAGPRSLNDLAAKEQVRPPTMSRIADALVREGMVKREGDKKDRRLVVLSATDKGIRLMHEGRSRRERLLLDLLRPLSKEETELLDRASETILKSLDTDR